MVKQKRKIQDTTSSPSLSSSSSSSSLTLHHQSGVNKIQKYKGVRMRSWGSWVSEIRAPNQKTRIWLGSYSTAEAAARAYDAALFCLNGPKSNLNFPHMITSSSLLIDHIDEKTVLSPKSIQKIAAQAANFLSSDQDPSPSSSAASSPAEDEHLASLKGSLVDYNEHMSLMDPSWYEYNQNEMFLINGTPFDYSPQLFTPSTTMDDFYDDSDIQLWSFS